jgi:hypothetical protein
MKLFIAGLVSLVLLSSCTKTVTNVQTVDQAFSAIYTLNPSGWGTTDLGFTFSTTLGIPELDQTIQDNGAVIVYLSFDNGATYEAIPEVFDGISYGSYHSTGVLTLDLHAVDGSTITAPGGVILAKVVLIDATSLD